jgi:hypothetical protein
LPASISDARRPRHQAGEESSSDLSGWVTAGKDRQWARGDWLGATIPDAYRSDGAHSLDWHYGAVIDRMVAEHRQRTRTLAAARGKAEADLREVERRAHETAGGGPRAERVGTTRVVMHPRNLSASRLHRMPDIGALVTCRCSG